MKITESRAIRVYADCEYLEEVDAFEETLEKIRKIIGAEIIAKGKTFAHIECDSEEDVKEVWDVLADGSGGKIKVPGYLRS